MAEEQDYAKDRIKRVHYHEALAKALAGWVIAREGWKDMGQPTYIFLAQKGSFDAQDLSTGILGPFLVIHHANGSYEPWTPTQTDMAAHDWACLTRQVMSRQVRQYGSDEDAREDVHQRDTKRVAVEEYRAGGRTSGMATSDSDFDAD